jgi:hypothetical protein
MSPLLKAADMEHETELVWVKPIQDYPWVRMTATDFYQPSGISKERLADIKRVHEDKQTLIGYANLSDDAPPTFMDGEKKHYIRRIFCINANDYDAYKDRDCFPTESVISRSLCPGFEGIEPSKKTQISARLPLDLFSDLHKHLHVSERRMTDVLIDAISQYIGSTSKTSLEKKIEALEMRVSALENS